MARMLNQLTKQIFCFGIKHEEAWLQLSKVTAANGGVACEVKWSHNEQWPYTETIPIL